MEAKIGQLVTYQGKKYKVSKIDGVMVTLRCAAGCPKTVKVHKDQL